MLIYKGYTFVRRNGNWYLLPYMDIAFGNGTIESVIAYIDDFEERYRNGEFGSAEYRD